MTAKKPTTMTEYIETFPKDVQEKLREMRDTIREVSPKADEGLKWGMPAFSYKRILVTFAAFKHHIGFYPTPSAVTAFQKELKGYVQARGSIQFPHDKPLPIALIKKIAAFRVKESIEQDGHWRT
jgi:uncharacterized protein YdhG (YjbR/CyaY superfamily)